MSDRYERAFQQAIVAESDDDTSRLVFADFLDDRGDPEMAAFIRAEVELATLDEADPTYPEVLARARRSGVLTRSDRRPWVDSIPGAKVMFHRGLIAGVTIPADVHANNLSPGWELLPLEQLAWVPREWDGASRWTADLGASLAARPELARVRTLITGGGPAFLAPLLTGCPHLSGLQALTIGGRPHGQSAEALMGLANRLDLPALDSLRMTSYWPPDEWQAVVRALQPQLRRLHLQSVSSEREWYLAYNESWFADLADCPLDSGVVWLSLSDLHSFGTTDAVWAVGDPSVAERAVLKAPGYGETLDLTGYSALRRLHLEMAPEGEGFGELSHHVSAARLQWFSTNNLFDEGARRFATGSHLTDLRRLSLHTSDSVILQGAYCQHLHRLEWGSGYHEIDTKALLNAQLPELRWLTLRARYPGGLLAALAAAKNMPNLCTLVVADSVQEVEPSLGQLATAPGLPHLSLVGVGSSYQRTWWVLGGGKAVRVHDGIDPVWRDQWEIDPTESWF